jgi:hypothetical protein
VHEISVDFTGGSLLVEELRTCAASIIQARWRGFLSRKVNRRRRTVYDVYDHAIAAVASTTSRLRNSLGYGAASPPRRPEAVDAEAVPALPSWTSSSSSTSATPAALSATTQREMAPGTDDFAVYAEKSSAITGTATTRGHQECLEFLEAPRLLVVDEKAVRRGEGRQEEEQPEDEEGEIDENGALVVRQHQAATGPWTCAKCSQWNDATATLTCAACGAPRPQAWADDPWTAMTDNLPDVGAWVSGARTTASVLASSLTDLLPRKERKEVDVYDNTGVEKVNVPANRGPDAPLNIFIFFSDTGGGHRASALSVEAALKQQYGSKVVVEIVDFIREGTGWPWCKIPEIYSTGTGNFPSVYKQVYDYDSNTSSWRDTKLYNVAWFCCRERILMFLAEIVKNGIDLAISVHPLINHMLVEAAALSLPLIHVPSGP